jgi:hypothetical protein
VSVLSPIVNGKVAGFLTTVGFEPDCGMCTVPNAMYALSSIEYGKKSAFLFNASWMSLTQISLISAMFYLFVFE